MSTPRYFRSVAALTLALVVASMLYVLGWTLMLLQAWCRFLFGHRG